MANLDIYQVIDRQDNNGQECLNVYFFRRDSVVGTGTDAQALWVAFYDNVLPAIQPVQNTSVIHNNLTVRNLFDDEDAWDEDISVAGTVTNADEMPIFNAINVTLSHDNPSIRPGSKRYTGLDELWNVNGVLSGATPIAAYTTLTDQLASPLPEGVIDTWFPVVVQRILEAGVYRLPTTIEEAVFGGIIAAVFNTLISSQNSRKIGTGA